MTSAPTTTNTTLDEQRISILSSTNIMRNQSSFDSVKLIKLLALRACFHIVNINTVK